MVDLAVQFLERKDERREGHGEQSLSRLNTLEPRVKPKELLSFFHSRFAGMQAR